MPVEWSIDVPTLWWIKLRVEVTSKVQSELPIELPSPKLNAEFGWESGHQQMGECRILVGSNHRGPSGLKRCRNRMQATGCDSGSD